MTEFWAVFVKWDPSYQFALYALAITLLAVVVVHAAGVVRAVACAPVALFRGWEPRAGGPPAAPPPVKVECTFKCSCDDDDDDEEDD